MSLKTPVRIVTLTLMGMLFTLLASVSGPGKRVDSFAYDELIQWRHWADKSPPTDPRILIVEIDERSRQERPLPIALWLPLYAQAFEGIFQGGAELIGFDVIATYDPPERLLPLAKVLLAYPDKTRMVGFYDQETNIEVLPADGIRAVLGDHHIGLSNLARDPDGIFRRQLLRDAKLEESTRPFFSRLLFEAVEPGKAVPDEVIVNFVGPPGTYPRLSFTDVVTWMEEGNSQKLTDSFQNKIVLIGGTARADLDFVETPFPSPMPGVEMHANILNTLLLNQPIEEKQHWFWYLFFLVPVAWTSLQKPLPLSSTVCGVASLCWALWSLRAISHGEVIEPLGVGIFGFVSTYLSGYLYRFNTVEKERRRIRSVFGRYVSPDVMEAMLEVPEDHKPELAKRQRVTVMFSDINDFSTACERLEPEDVTGRLNDYFDEMTKIIYAHEGTIIRFIGDEFMVLFGAPKSNDKSEELAVLSAVRMVKKLQDLKAKDPSGDGGFYEVKIGIHVGDMILTSIGNEIRSDYNCIGDSTNMAARVLSLTKPLGATVLISEDVKTRVEHRPELTFKDLGTHPVKGRAGEVHVFEAMLAGD